MPLFKLENDPDNDDCDKRGCNENTLKAVFVNQLNGEGFIAYYANR